MEAFVCDLMMGANEGLFAKVARFTQLKEEEARKEERKKKQLIDLVAVFVVLFRSEVDLLRVGSFLLRGVLENGYLIQFLKGFSHKHSR